MLSIFEKQPAGVDFDYQKQLKSVPVKNRHVSIVSSAPDRVVLGVDLKYRGLMKIAAKIFTLDTLKKYELTDVALEIYREINGSQTVENLIDTLKDRYLLTFLEARSLVIQYLATLMGKGLIVIVGSADDGDPV